MKFINSLESEWIKTKNSAVLWLTIGGGLFVPLLIAIGRLTQYQKTLISNSLDGLWLKLLNQNWQFLSIFLLPMGIILVSSLLAQIEYRNNTWKQLYVSPQKYTTLFFAKYSMLMLLLIVFFLVFNLGVYLAAVVPAIVFPDVPYPNEPFPLKEFVKSNATYFLNCLPIVALQFLLSFHIRNFIIPLGIGLGLVIASLIGINSKYGYLIPYTYCELEFLNQNNPKDSIIQIRYWAAAYFLYFSVVNYMIFRCKTQTEPAKYFKLKPLVWAFLLVLLVTLSLLVYNHKRLSNKASLLLSQSKIQQSMQLVENNLGSFILENNSDWHLTERMKFYKVKGLSIAVVQNYKIIWAKGYGWANEAEKIPVTENTIFEPGSLSKSVNALALMQMVQDKKIDLFGNINHFLTSWKFPYDSLSHGKKITLANLLNHTAGLSVHGFEGYKLGDSLPTIVQILNGETPANSKPVRSMFEPNVKMAYSGGGTMISQLLLMDISQQPYDQYMQTHILKPLEMTHSFYTQPLPDNKKQYAALGYDSAGNELSFKYPIMVEQAAAGLWTTPSDLCKFIIAIQNALKGNASSILSQQYARLMLTPYIDERAAFGFFIDDMQDSKYFSHEAGNWGFSGAFYGSFENGNGLAILINSENDKIIKELANNVVDVYDWSGFDKKQTKKVVNIDDTILKKYLGAYQSSNLSSEIIKENNAYYYIVNNEKRKMYFISPTEFLNLESPTLKSFEIDPQGVVKGFKNIYKNNQTLFKKIK